MQLSVDPNHTLPPSRQLVEAVLDAIASGRLAPGDRLPSVREAAVQALVNANTVGKAWRELQWRGVAESRSGRGVFVTRNAPSIAIEAREGATRDAFLQAVRQARAAGHDQASLHAWVDRVVAEETDEPASQPVDSHRP